MKAKMIQDAGVFLPCMWEDCAAALGLALALIQRHFVHAGRLTEGDGRHALLGSIRHLATRLSVPKRQICLAKGGYDSSKCLAQAHTSS